MSIPGTTHRPGIIRQFNVQNKKKFEVNRADCLVPATTRLLPKVQECDATMPNVNSAAGNKNTSYALVRLLVYQEYPIPAHNKKNK